MKTRKDPRHLQRVSVMQELFAMEFSRKNKPKLKYTKEIVEKQDEINKLLTAAAPLWPVDKINKIDLAILRLAVFELMFGKDAPPKVIVDEAVELGKEYGSDASPSFINGALGKLIEEHNIAT